MEPLQAKGMSASGPNNYHHHLSYQHIENKSTNPSFQFQRIEGLLLPCLDPSMWSAAFAHPPGVTLVQSSKKPTVDGRNPAHNGMYSYQLV